MTAEPTDIADLTYVEIESKRASIPHLVDPVEVDRARREQRWAAYFRGESPVGSKPERRIFKAIVDGGLAGYVGGHLTSRYEMEAEIQSFYVLREHQRKGIGSALLSTFAAWLASLGVNRLCVGIAPENPYRAFYTKHGARYLNEHWLYWTEVYSLLSRHAQH